MSEQNIEGSSDVEREAVAALDSLIGTSKGATEFADYLMKSGDDDSLHPFSPLHILHEIEDHKLLVEGVIAALAAFEFPNIRNIIADAAGLLKIQDPQRETQRHPGHRLGEQHKLILEGLLLALGPAIVALDHMELKRHMAITEPERMNQYFREHEIREELFPVMKAELNRRVQTLTDEQLNRLQNSSQEQSKNKGHIVSMTVLFLDLVAAELKRREDAQLQLQS